METILPSEFKRQMVLMLEGIPYVIEEFHSTGTAQTRHKLHTRLRQLKSGHVIERVFADNERVPVGHVQTRRITYSYSQSDVHVFLDAETFEEFDLSGERLGERRWFLKENEEYKALLLEGALVDVSFRHKFPLRLWTRLRRFAVARTQPGSSPVGNRSRSHGAIVHCQGGNDPG